MKKYIFELLCTLLISGSTFTVSAQTFQTREGSIAVVGTYNDTSIIANSNHLFAFINYETAEIELRLLPRTLQTGIDSLDAKLLASTLPIATLKGKMNIPYVNTLGHSDNILNFESEIQVNGISKPAFVSGSLKHIASNGAISCILSLTLTLNLADFAIAVRAGWKSEVSIMISQAVLRKSNQ